MTRNEATKLVLDEIDRIQAEKKSLTSSHEAYALLLEEMDEIWAEVKAGQATTHRGVSEAVQIAAVAVCYLMDLCPDVAASEHEAKVARHQESQKKRRNPALRAYVHDNMGYSSGGYSG